MRRASTVVVTALLGLGLMAGPAHAVEGDLFLKPQRVADVNRAGTHVSWGVKFECPKGQKYSLSLFVGQRDPVGYPDLVGEDTAVSARRDVRGVCTGKVQRVTRTMKVTKTTRPSGEVTFIPMRRSDTTSAEAILTVPPESFALYCAAPNCASETGPFRIVIR